VYKKGKLFVVSGPSGVGKTSIIKSILSKDILFSISYTTRKKREKEINGEDYFFISEKEFLDMVYQGNFLEWEKVHGAFYGTSKKWIEEKLNIGKSIILDIDVKGAKNVKEKLGGVLIFIAPPSIEILALRIKNRKTETDIDIERRLSVAKKEMLEKNIFDFVIENNILEESVKKLKEIINTKTNIF